MVQRHWIEKEGNGKTQDFVETLIFIYYICNKGKTFTPWHNRLSNLVNEFQCPFPLKFQKIDGDEENTLFSHTILNDTGSYDG